MRAVHAVLLLAVSASPTLAQRAPVIVVPGKPGVPVLMNGVDVSWAVIEGEFGLDRPGEMTPTVIYRPWIVPYYATGSYEPGYFPTTGQHPGYGRFEVIPPPDRPLLHPAPSYHRSWSSQSAPGAVTEYPPFNTPPVVVSKRGGGRNGREGREDAPQDPSNGRR